MCCDTSVEVVILDPDNERDVFASWVVVEQITPGIGPADRCQDLVHDGTAHSSLDQCMKWRA